MRLHKITALAVTAALAATLTAGTAANAATLTPAAATAGVIAFADTWYLANSSNGFPGHITVNKTTHAVTAVPGKSTATYIYGKSITDSQAQALLNTEYNKIAKVLAFACDALNVGDTLVINTSKVTLESHYKKNGKDVLWQTVSTAGLTTAQVNTILTLAKKR
jgi:hypothetical protein